MKKVLLLLAKGFEVYEMSAFHDVITWNLVDGNHETEIETCGITKEVVGTGNIKVIVDKVIDEINIDNYVALAIPGGFDEYDFYDDAYNEKFLNLIRLFHLKDKIIASICVGALAIGKSGVLENKKATTYNKKNGIRQKRLKEFNVDVVNEPIVMSDNILTSWNPSTAIPVALKLLELITTKKNSDYIKDIMGY